MARNLVFKADRNGLVINLDEECDFIDIKKSLQKKFNQGERFFEQDMIVKIDPGERSLSRKEKQELLEVFKQLSGVSVVEFINNNSPAANSKTNPEDSTLLIKRTLRSGQSIDSEGNIVIQGDINPGAEVIAGKDILVLGEIRGIAHAGANGDLESTISAFRLQPIQLRIANYISRAPDEEINHPNRPEIAFIKDDKIVLDYLK
jgi:septum site-determining protein MinC